MGRNSRRSDRNKSRLPKRRRALNIVCIVLIFASLSIVFAVFALSGGSGVRPVSGSAGYSGLYADAGRRSPGHTPAVTPTAKVTPSERVTAAPSATPAVTVTPTAAAATATPAPATSEPPRPTESRTPSASPHSPVEDSFFDGAVFVGDSVTLKLQYYMSKQRRNGSTLLGNARFLAAGSLGSGNALWPVSNESVHPSYQGVKMTIQDGVQKIKADKVYLMLGMNDIAVYGLEGSLENMDRLINKIIEKSPGVSVYIESVTPILQGREKYFLNNENIRKYNSMLCDFCGRKDYVYLDVASEFEDGNGYLITEYCSDPEGMGIHLTDRACNVWIEYLYTHS